MAWDKGIVTAAVVVLAGVVGYKVLKKKKPELIKKCRRSLSHARENVTQVFREAKNAFREGYQHA